MSSQFWLALKHLILVPSFLLVHSFQQDFRIVFYIYNSVPTKSPACSGLVTRVICKEFGIYQSPRQSASHASHAWEGIPGIGGSIYQSQHALDISMSSYFYPAYIDMTVAWISSRGYSSTVSIILFWFFYLFYVIVDISGIGVPRLVLWVKVLSGSVKSITNIGSEKTFQAPASVDSLSIFFFLVCSVQSFDFLVRLIQQTRASPFVWRPRVFVGFRNNMLVA